MPKITKWSHHVPVFCTMLDYKDNALGGSWGEVCRINVLVNVRKPINLIGLPYENHQTKHWDRWAIKVSLSQTSRDDSALECQTLPSIRLRRASEADQKSHTATKQSNITAAAGPNHTQQHQGEGVSHNFSRPVSLSNTSASSVVSLL